jgi:hypothetical protein
MKKTFMQLVCTALMLSQISLIAADLSPLVKTLPKLTEMASWQVKSGDENVLSLFDRNDWLEVGFKCDKGNKGYLLLKQPVPIPEVVNGMNFYCTNSGASASLRIMLVISDAKGNEFLYHTKSLHSFKYGLFNLEHHTRHSSEMQFSVPGLETPRVVPASGATITGVSSRKTPVKPLSLKGLYFEGNHQRASNKKLPIFYFREFTLSGLSPQNSDLYYLFNDQPFFGEVTPLPYITPCSFLIWWGKKFDVTWEVYDQYAGQPVMSGREVVNVNKGSGDLPVQLQLAKHIQIPVTGKGTWWVRAKLRRWARKDTGAPDQIEEKEYRLYVHKGEKAETLKPLSSKVAIAGNHVRIAPARDSLTFSASEPFIVPVQFAKPDTAPAALSCKVEVRRGHAGKLVKEADFAPEWDEKGLFTGKCDVSELPAGAYEITGMLLLGGKVFDRTTRMVGRKTTAAPAKSASNIPASVPAANDVISGKEPMFILCPIPPIKERDKLQLAWDKHLRPFLDHAKDLSSDIEMQISWKSIEPLPGVYDWSTVDRFVNYAGQKGLRVILQPEFRAWNTPEWVASYFEENPKGSLVGHSGYTFHGGRPNLLDSPIRQRILILIERLVERYRSNPVVLGYFACVEHPGDAPYNGWYEGYSPESRQRFVAYCRERWQDLDRLNKRWNTAYGNWEDIDHPRGNVSERRYFDWLQFRMQSIDSFHKGIVTAIRALDPKRLIIMYGVKRDADWFRDRGCISANGGSHDTMQMLSYARFGAKNFSQRTEDHSPGNWSQYFPTQMDASVFAMTVGGGVSTHTKAFIHTNVPWEKYMNVKSKRGRYRRFMPIWRELRHTECPSFETLVYNSLPGYLVNKKTTYSGWYDNSWATINLQAAHIPACYADLPDLKHAKLVLLVHDRPVLEQQEIDQLSEYVKSGGTIMMLPEYGRTSLEDPETDWALLRKLGFNPPLNDKPGNRYRAATPVQGKIFPSGAMPFTLRNIWSAAPDADAHVAASFDKANEHPAITWKTVGKGKVVLVWANTIVPPMFAKDKYAFVRDIAKWAGMKPGSNASTDLIWTNLLKSKDSDTWYGLAFVGQWQNKPKSKVSGTVQWLTLPPGNYDVTELISGRNVGTFSAEQLKRSGLNTSLNPRELAIYKMSKRD